MKNVLVTVKAMTKINNITLPVIISITNTQRGVEIAKANAEAQGLQCVHVVPFTEIHGVGIAAKFPNGITSTFEIVSSEMAEFTLERYRYLYPEIDFFLDDKTQSYFADLLENHSDDLAI